MKKRHKALIWALAAVIAASSVYYFGVYLRHTNQILLVGGSSTVMRYAAALGDALTKRQSDITVVLGGGSSTPALIAVKNQAIDVAVVSRDLEDDEDDDYARSTLIARDAIGFYVNPENPVKDLTGDQLKALFTGETSNWSQLGGKNLPVRAVACGPESASGGALNELILGDAAVDGRLKTVESDEAAMALVAGDPSAIGCVLFHGEPVGVRALSVSGVPLSRETVLSDRYPLSRSTFLVVHDLLKPGGEDEFAALRAFVRFFNGDDEQSLEERRANAIRSYLALAKSPEGQAILESEGALRVY